MESVIQKAIRSSKAYYCLECGKCTAVCPIAGRNPEVSPRCTVEGALLDDSGLLLDQLLWACLTCMRCSQVCPSDVAYAEFIRDLRVEARRVGQEGLCTHGEAIQTWMRMMTEPDLRQNRLGWLNEGLKTSADSDTVYFVGCLPYYDVLFREIGARGVEIARAVVKILNHLGIEPHVLPDERCCGHDLLWEGDVANFRQLAELNIALLRETGAKRIVTACPECARTLKVDYPAYVGDLGMEIVHIAEFLAQKVAEGALRTTHHAPRIVTYHDPCRLGRHLGVYDAPRQVIEALGLELLEMAHSGKSALCCGTSCWTNCGATNKQIQVDRLREAKATGADLLVTACPKCQIHFTCAMDDEGVGEEVGIEVQDLVTLVAGSMGNRDKELGIGGEGYASE